MTKNTAKLTQLISVCPLCGAHTEKKCFFPKSSGFGWQCMDCGLIMHMKSGFLVRDYSEMR